MYCAENAVSLLRQLLLHGLRESGLKIASLAPYLIFIPWSKYKRYICSYLFHYLFLFVRHCVAIFRPRGVGGGRTKLLISLAERYLPDVLVAAHINFLELCNVRLVQILAHLYSYVLWQHRQKQTLLKIYNKKDTQLANKRQFVVHFHKKKLPCVLNN